jgi:PAS domain S-box-containing protein
MASLTQTQGATGGPDSEEHLLAESVKDYAIFILDPTGHVSTWNAGAERIKGYTARQIIGKHFSVFYPPEVGTSSKCEHELEVATRAGRFEEEGWRLRQDGSRLWANVTITALRSPEGALVGFAKVIQDLTARRQAEQDAQRFRLLVETVKDYAIFILDPAGYVSTWNAGAERIKGYTARQIIGKHFSVFYPPDVRSTGKCEYELEVATHEGRFEEEGWRLRQDGSRLWANVTITALRSPDGTLLGFAKVTQDLTARRQAEEETRRFQLLVESVKDYAIFILDPSGHVSTWNAGAERIKGYTARQIIGKHFSVFYPPEVIITGTCDHELEVAAREGRFEEEGWRLRQDGSRLWANVTITALRSPDGALVGFAKVTQDLTQRRAAEEARRALAAERTALAEKERIHSFQERFLAILGHDLRNPLASLDMGVALLGQRNTDPAMLRTLERMGCSSRRMSRMIEQLLDFTRIRLAGGLQLDVQPMDLRAAIETIAHELSAAHPSKTIRIHCQPALGNWDRDRLEQVFSNLVGNAMIHGEEDSPVIIEARLQDGVAQVDVHNEGPPIPPELQASLFNPFRRGERDSRTPKTAGLGLGLYISQELVHAHHGTLDFRSDATNGTTFRVNLPHAAAVPRSP